jgi:hypothetical protein
MLWIDELMSLNSPAASAACTKDCKSIWVMAFDLTADLD